MPLSQRAVRTKIRSVKNIQKITSAMKMVAAARLRRVQQRVTAGKPYAERLERLVQTVAPLARDVEHPLLSSERDRAGRTGLVLFSGDKGLCGSFNNNIIRLCHEFVMKSEDPIELITVGRKGRDYFKKRGQPIKVSFPQPGVTASLSEVQAIARAVTGLYTEGEVDEVHIAYTEFENTIKQVPRVVKFLPIEPPSVDQEGDENPTADQSYIFEPEASRLLAELIPRFVDNQVYRFLLESMASEQGARMTAMSNATENAGELIDDLTLALNKARQAAITKELLEVVSGADALEQAS